MKIYTPPETGKACRLSLSGGGDLTVMGGDVKIRTWEDTSAQKWTIEALDGYYGFRNMSSGKVLGVNFFGYVAGGTSELKEWEMFSFDTVDGGHRFKVRFKDRECFLVRPSLEDHLKVSYEVGYSTPITITYI